MNDGTALELTHAYLQQNDFKNIRHFMAHSPCVIDAEKDGIIYDVAVIYSNDDFEVSWRKLEGLLSVPFSDKNHRVLLMFVNDLGLCLFEMIGGRISSLQNSQKENEV
jgi:hypothetical protein